MSNTTIYEPGVNPAISLYNLWHTLLAMNRYQYAGENTIGTFNNPPGGNRMVDWSRTQPLSRSYRTFGYGRNGWVIGIIGFDTNDQPVFGYGRNVRYYGLDAKFGLAADGRFFVPSYLTPTDRAAIEEATFLACRWQFSRYQWHVALENRYESLADPDRRFHYVSEYVLTGRWHELYQGEHGHGLRPTRNQNCPGVEATDEQSAWKKAEAVYLDNNRLVERRYRIAENKKRVAAGLPKLSARTATVRDGGQVIDTEAAVLQVAALMDVTQPAKTVPLRPLRREAHTTRLKEAQHG